MHAISLLQVFFYCCGANECLVSFLSFCRLWLCFNIDLLERAVKVGSFRWVGLLVLVYHIDSHFFSFKRRNG